MKKSALVLLLFYLLAACTSAPGDKSQVKPTTVPTGPLRQLAQQRGLLVGTSVVYQPLRRDATYAATLAREFDVITPENVMKFDATEPFPDTYTFGQADTLVQFAQAHQMQVHGHNLVWHQALPDWITQGTFTRDQLMTVLKNHVQSVVSHYKDQVNMWDVVNEGVNEDGSLRQSIWERIIGSKYIDLAFQWAHEANPRAHLFYNDYDAEGMGVKSDAVYKLLKGMVERGIPIYGVGLQMHISIDRPPVPSDVIANMQRLAALGLKVQVTEMDVQIEIQADPRSLTERLEFQAQTYSAILRSCLAVKGCESFTMWGFTDRYTWIPQAVGHPDQPLIFDENYRPKPAYKALVQTLAP